MKYPPELWNNIPDVIKSSKTISKFKSQVKVNMGSLSVMMCNSLKYHMLKRTVHCYFNNINDNNPRPIKLQWLVVLYFDGLGTV